jgi:TolB-like protein
LAVVLAGCGVLAAAGFWFHSQNTAIPLAVLPFANLSPDSADEYIADGLTDEIIRNLSILDGLTVRSQTSSFTFKPKARNVREARRELEADYILEGSVLRSGQQWRVNTQLVRARDDSPVWSGRFDREVTDVLAVQDEISRGIVNSLRLKLGHGRRRYETNTEVYDMYLRARAAATRTFPGRPEVIDLFEKAVDLVLFWSLDRFSREGALATLKYLEMLGSYGVGFRSYSEQYLDSCGIFKDAVLRILACVTKQEWISRAIAPRPAWLEPAAKGASAAGQSWSSIASALCGWMRTAIPNRRLPKR